MTSRKISQYDAITNVQSDDLLVVVDVHDTSMASSGTTKRMTLAQAGGVGAADYAPTGLTGATAASRYVGATASGAPASGTFAVGDFVIDQTGKVWICTAAGSPGTWAAAGPTIPVTIAQGGTGQTTQQAAIDALAGAQTAAQFLRGNGTHVQMSAIQPGDLASVTNEAGNAPLVLTPSGTFAWGLPWQFYADAYGAKGDGKVLGDVVTNSTTTITSASANFTAGDVGKYIMIHGANGSSSGPLITTIASFTNSTTVVLTAAATASVSNCPAVYGTDDTAAINSALSAAGTYATSHQYFAEVVFGAKIYILGTGPTQTGNGSTTPTFNTQLALPYPNANGTTQKMVLALTGAGDAGYLQYWESTTPNVTGTALVSMLNPSSSAANNATFGRQSVIGGPSGSAGFTGGFANMKVVVKGIGVWCAIWHNLIAFDFLYMSAMRVTQSGAQVFAPTGVNGGVQPYVNNIGAAGLTAAISQGFRCPNGGNNLDVWMDDVAVEGYEIGFLIADHFAAGRLNSIYCDVAMKWDASLGPGTQHSITIQSAAMEAYNGGFRTNGGSAQVFINWDTEGSGPAYDINDGSSLFGFFYFGDKVDNRAPVVSNGASNLKIINCNLGPGHMSSPPSVPASTSSAALVYRDAMVVVHTGAGVTVSAITVDGTATSQTVAAASSSVPIRVPAGKTIALTYAGGTPTWDWWLD